MKNLNQYILEKFKISKNTKTVYSHEEFTNKDDTFNYIKDLCKGFGFRTKTNGYWLYVYKSGTEFPYILFTYSTKDDYNNKLNNLCLSYYNGRNDKGINIINTGIEKVKEIPYPEDFDTDKTGKSTPTEYNIMYSLNLLDNFENEED